MVQEVPSAARVELCTNGERSKCLRPGPRGGIRSFTGRYLVLLNLGRSSAYEHCSQHNSEACHVSWRLSQRCSSLR